MRSRWSSAVLTALAGLLSMALTAVPVRAGNPPEAVFAGALDVTDDDADRGRLSQFASFVATNAGKTVRLSLQLYAPAAWPKSVFSSWARLEWTTDTGKTQQGALRPDAKLDGVTRLSIAFCRCDGNFEAPFQIDIPLDRRAGADPPDLSWLDDRLLVRGRFRVEGPTEPASVRRYRLVPAPARPR